MARLVRWRARLACLGMVLLVLGCATPTGTALVKLPDGPTWSGRLLLKAETEPPTRFSAGFVLHGSPERGKLSLSTPLGTTLAHVGWEPGRAELNGAGQLKTFESLALLTETLTGTTLPVAALFDWLNGQNTRTDGWEADLSGLGSGRIGAERLAPGPKAELRLVLDTESP